MDRSESQVQWCNLLDEPEESARVAHLQVQGTRLARDHTSVPITCITAVELVLDDAQFVAYLFGRIVVSPGRGSAIVVYGDITILIVC